MPQLRGVTGLTSEAITTDAWDGKVYILQLKATEDNSL